LKKKSISFQLTLWFSSVFLLGFIVFGSVMWLDLRYSLGGGRDRTLSRRGSRIVDLLKAARNESAAERMVKFLELADAMPEGNLTRVYDEQGRLLYPDTPNTSDFPWPKLTHNPGDIYIDVDYAGHPYRALVRNVEVNSQPLTVVVGGQLEDNRNLLSRFATGLKTATPVLLLVSALCGYFLSRRALAPVDRLTAAVRSISIGNLSQRLPIYQTGDELQRLAETCNDMLARLEGAVSRINQFTADASHELRSPISFVRTVSEYALHHQGLDVETRQVFEDIFAESMEAGRLLEDLLTLARADAGRMDVTLELLNLTQLVEDICEKSRPLAEKKLQSLVVRTGNGRAAQVSGDFSSLRRLVWILLDNAIKYTPERGRIEVLLESTKSEIKLSVKDSGVGIPKELLPRVFDRFFRVDPARSQAEGTGLGLAIAKWITDSHTAVLSVESVEGVGSEFSVVFPAHS
jgi:two-component system, OmpR family, heavy metal sensor histidine kinase CusS